MKKYIDINVGEVTLKHFKIINLGEVILTYFNAKLFNTFFEDYLTYANQIMLYMTKIFIPSIT